MDDFNDKIGICEVCGNSNAVYTCPKCEVRTCCLECVNIHKKELQCDGIRDKTKFIPIKKFTNIDLLSDYRLIEEITRSTEGFKKDEGKHFSRINRLLPLHLFRLRAAAARRDMMLKFLPGNFTRHKINTTYLDWKTQIINWRVEWIFPNAENIKCIDEHCKESEKIGTLLSKYFNPALIDKNLSESLKFYQSTGLNSVKIFLKAEQKAGKKFYELDHSMTLKECLKFKIIIEFPSIYIVLNQHADSYDVVDTDDEVAETDNTDDKKIKNENVLLRLSSIKREKEDKKRNHKNLLFVSEYSDMELSSSDEECSQTKIKIPRREI